MSQRRLARLIPIERMTLRYEPHRDPQEALRIRLRELAGSRVRYGYRRLTVLLKREGWEVALALKQQGSLELSDGAEQVEHQLGDMVTLPGKD